MPIPSGTIDEQSEQLAPLVAKGSVPALLTSLQLCGVGVEDGKGKMLVSPPDGKGMGIRIEANEVFILAAANRGPHIPMGTLSDVLSIAVPPKKASEVQQGLIVDIRRALRSENASDRFWARFICDLGIFAPTSASLENPDIGMLSRVAGANLPPGQIGFDANELAKLSQEMQAAAAAGDQAKIKQLQAKMEALMKGGTRSADATPFEHDGTELSFLQATLILRRLHGDAFVLAKNVYNDEKPAGPFADEPVDVSGYIYDSVATAGTTAFGEFTGWMAETLREGSKYVPADVVTADRIERYSRIANVANLIASWGKMIMTFGCFKAELEPDPFKFSRRKDRMSGPNKFLTGTLSLDVGKVSEFNRIRPVLHFGGLDVTFPADGPIKGSEVHWEITDPERAVRPALTVGDPPLQGGDGYKADNRTDSAGKAKNPFQTTPQREPKPENSSPYERSMKIDVLANIKGRDLVQDMIDLISTALAVAGDPPAGIIAAIPEIMYRTKFHIGTSFPVIEDWRPPQWEGEYTLTVKGSGDATKEDVHYEWTIDRTIQGKLEATPILAGLPNNGAGTYVAKTSRYTVNDRWSANGKMVECGYTGPFSTVITEKGPPMDQEDMERMLRTAGTAAFLANIGGSGQVTLTFVPSGTGSWNLGIQIAPSLRVRSKTRTTPAPASPHPGGANGELNLVETKMSAQKTFANTGANELSDTVTQTTDHSWDEVPGKLTFVLTWKLRRTKS